MNLTMTIIIASVIAGLGAGVLIGLAGVSAAMVISPMLITLCGFPAYEAVTIALTADVLASALVSRSYAENGNIDVKNGVVMMVSVLVFTVVGSWASSFFPNTALSGGSFFMATVTGIVFILKPADRTSSRLATLKSRTRIILSFVVGIPVGLICGFVGAGGGVMMLFVLTIILGYDLKTAVGTSTFIMTFTAATGAISHIVIGGWPNLLALAVCTITTPIGAHVMARYANKMSVKLQNRVTGWTLFIMGVVLAVMNFM